MLNVESGFQLSAADVDLTATDQGWTGTISATIIVLGATITGDIEYDDGLTTAALAIAYPTADYPSDYFDFQMNLVYSFMACSYVLCLSFVGSDYGVCLGFD